MPQRAEPESQTLPFMMAAQETLSSISENRGLSDFRGTSLGQITCADLNQRGVRFYGAERPYLKI